MKKSNVVVNYFMDSVSELRKVTWPTSDETIRLTIIVLVFSLIAALLFGVLDYGLNFGFTSLIELFSNGQTS